MYALKRQQRGCKKRWEKGYEQSWSGLSVTVIEPYEASEGLNNLRFFFMSCLKNGVAQGHRVATVWPSLPDSVLVWDEGFGDLKWDRKGKSEWGKAKILQDRKTSVLLCTVGTMSACAARDRVFPPLPGLKWQCFL